MQPAERVAATAARRTRRSRPAREGRARALPPGARAPRAAAARRGRAAAAARRPGCRSGGSSAASAPRRPAQPQREATAAVTAETLVEQEERLGVDLGEEVGEGEDGHVEDGAAGGLAIAEARLAQAVEHREPQEQARVRRARSRPSRARGRRRRRATPAPASAAGRAGRTRGCSGPSAPVVAPLGDVEVPARVPGGEGLRDFARRERQREGPRPRGGEDDGGEERRALQSGAWTREHGDEGVEGRRRPGVRLSSRRARAGTRFAEPASRRESHEDRGIAARRAASTSSTRNGFEKRRTLRTPRSKPPVRTSRSPASAYAATRPSSSARARAPRPRRGDVEASSSGARSLMRRSRVAGD